MRKLSSILLCLSMVFTSIFTNNINVKAIDEEEKSATPVDMVVDDQTYRDWEKSFGSQDTKENTSDAGRIWTNKSVWDGDAKSADEKIEIKRSDVNNFLVGLSVISSNKEIVGEASLPVDVVFVLDMSGSMSRRSQRYSQMATAADSAIEKLLTNNNLHKDNRIGVVTYAENSEVLLPLDSYQAGTSGNYLEPTTWGDRNQNKGIRVARDLKYSNGNLVVVGRPNEIDSVKRVQSTGGTYIQAGIKAGAEMLIEANNKDVDGVKRIPILIVMSDGEPTYYCPNYVDVNSRVGNGSSFSKINGFFTQLTGQYYKGRVTEAYGKDTLIYTLGLGLDVEDEGYSVLDPTGDTSENKKTYNEYLASFNAPDSNGYYELEGENYKRQNDNDLNSNNFNDKYFGANEENLNTVFDEIVQQIILQSKYYPTDNQTGSQNISGYVTFEDELGPYMEVKKMNGLLFDNSLQTGANFAKGATNNADENYNFGSENKPNPIGDEFVRSLKDRLRIQDTGSIHALIRAAFEDGQISYTDENNYSNYIAWYADADGNYLGFAPKNMTNIPEGAVNFNRSYFYLSKRRVQEQETSLMYISVRVEENIQTGSQKVVYKIPSSLLPLVMYNVTVNGDNVDTATDVSITREGAYPARLFYEVGLKDEINEFNVLKTVKNDEYSHIGEDGKVYFYSNAWETGEKGKTTATFSPNTRNEYYYFPKNTPIYTDEKCTTPLTTEPKKGESYYYKKSVFEVDNSESDVTKVQTSKVDQEIVKLPERTLFEFKDENGEASYAKDGNGHYYMKIGVPKDSINYQAEIKNSIDITNTAEYSIYPEIVPMENNEKVTVNVYHGNNGRFYIEQKSGVMIEKKFTTENPNENPNQLFKFTAVLEGEALSTLDNIDVAIFDKDGNRTDKELSINENKINIELKENEKAYIVLPVGVKYQISEDDLPKDYLLTEVQGSENVGIINNVASGTVRNATMDETTFINSYEETAQVTIEKILAKDSYLQPDKSFDFELTINPDTDKEITQKFQLKAGENKVINVPVGAKVQVKEIVTNYDTEINSNPEVGTIEIQGKTWILDSVVKDQNITVTYTNEYNATPVEYDVTTGLKALKTLVGRNFLATDSFEFEVLDEGNNVVSTGTLTDDVTENEDGSYSKKITFDKKLVFNTPGEYKYTIKEKAGNIAGIDYSIDEYSLTITVIEDEDGKLVATSTIKLGEDIVESIEFKNTYQATSTEVQLTATKTLEGRALKGNDFTFVLKDSENNVISEVKNNSNGVVSFDKLTFDKAGTYNYTVSEVGQTGSNDGITYDDRVYDVEVVVIDDGSGQLVATPTIKQGNATVESIEFKNTYQASSTGVQLTATKTLTGRALRDNDFTFVLKDSDGKEIQRKTNAADGKVLFDTLKFDKAGTYNYTVSEVAKTGSNDGITYDGRVYDVIVEVIDDGSGKLVATSTIKQGNATVESIEFKNTYQARSTEVQLTATKTLTGKALKGNDFTFVLKDSEGKEIQSKTNTADGKVLFDTLKFDKAGTYNYTVSEVAKTGSNDGITYDGRVYDVIVEVIDDGSGKLVATSTIKQGNATVESIQFNNSYKPDEGSVSGSTDVKFTFKKVLTGRDWLENETFTFKIKPLNGAPEVTDDTVIVNKENAESFTFEDIKFTSDDMNGATVNENGVKSKIFEYEVYEDVANITDGTNGMTYDRTHAKVEIIVIDDGNGQLSASVTTNDHQTFTNKYSSNLVYDTSAGLDIVKTLTGRDMTAGQFSFIIAAQDDASAKKAGISEGLEMKVTNTDALDGAQSVMKPFANMIFNQADDGITYSYTIREDTTNKKAGYDYDGSVYLVTIQATDNGDATLNVTTTVTKDGQSKSYTNGKRAQVEFNNTYNAGTSIGGEGNTSINASKEFVNAELEAGQFSFVVKDVKGNTVSTGQNDEDGKINFSEINYSTGKFAEDVKNGIATKKATENGYEYEYQYTVSEVIEDDFAQNGITADRSSFSIVVTVVDDGKGNLTAEVTYPEGTEDLLEFKNTYATNPISININGMKFLDLEDKNLQMSIKDIAGMFEFSISSDDENTPLPKNTTVTNDESGNIDFGEIEYKLDDLEGAEVNPENGSREKVFEYTIKEINEVPFIDNDEKTERTIIVIVRDDGQGHLTASVEGEREDCQFIFTNTYSVDPTDSSITKDGEFNITKKLEGRELKEAEFEFVMKDLDGNIVSRGTNDVNGKVSMESIQFDYPGVYQYTLSEENGGITSNGIKYDSKSYNVTATVTDNLDGTLKVEWTRDGVEEKNMEFTNTYTFNSVTVQLGAVKALVGRELKEGEFNFELSSGEEVIQTQSNNAQGGVEFEGIEFKEEGTYKFTIKEVKGTDEEITYDEAVYEVVVEVKDNGLGQLEATFTKTKEGKEVDAVVFVNKYEKAEEPNQPEEPSQPENPVTPPEDGNNSMETGDGANVMGYFIMMMVSAMGILLGLIKKRKELLHK